RGRGRLMFTGSSVPVAHTLLIAERFGPTLQGEGPSTGQQALFIRLSRCNLTCPACDTAYSWDWSRFDPAAEASRLPVDELVDWVLASSTRLVVITGGEPLLQQPGLVGLVRALADARRRVEIETNGTHVPSPELIEAVAQFTVSPKLSTFGAGMGEARRINAAALRGFMSGGKSVFKFVITTPADLVEITELERRFGLSPVWVMPEGTTRAAVLSGMSWLAEEALTRGWHLSGRLHVLLWGDERGR
ncbi:MAG: 7-carboxy-7-deazaguanine synthase QueE, partial [Pseudonocardiaceae bacterium]